MYFKLSLQNIKKSMSDYLIYFFSITLAVMLFYVFNCISQQQVMMDLTANQTEMMGTLDNVMTVTSVFISIIFFLLCLMANQFFMKRRKKEFGLYMTLGMSKSKVSRILIIETLLIGALALVTGLIAGILLSQGMAVLTASLFDVAITGYVFIFSLPAMLKAIGFFCGIFVLVILFNTFTINKYTLLELLTASKKAQGLIIKNSRIAYILSFFSLLAMGFAYVLILNSSIVVDPIPMVSGLVLLIGGSIGFYLAGVTVFIHRLKKSKKHYYKGISIYNIGQLHSKVRTSIASIVAISFLLFFTMTTLISGFSYKHALEKELQAVAAYDVSLQIYYYNGARINDYHEALKDLGINEEQHQGQIVGLETYDSDQLPIDVLYPYADKNLKSEFDKGYLYLSNVIKKSDYISLMNLLGRTPKEIGKGEVLLLTNVTSGQTSIETMTKEKTEYTLFGTELKLAKDGYDFIGIRTEEAGNMLLSYVVDDELLENRTPKSMIINLQYPDQSPEMELEYLGLIDGFYERYEENLLGDPNLSVTGLTSQRAYEDITGYTTNLLYIGIYIGIVFLISAGAMIGLRILTTASDEKDQYLTLYRMGADRKRINQSVGLQVLGYFGFPLILAIPHTIMAVSYVTNLISPVDSLNLVPAILFTGLILAVLYGGYFLISYHGFRKIIEKK